MTIVFLCLTSFMMIISMSMLLQMAVSFFIWLSHFLLYIFLSIHLSTDTSCFHVLAVVNSTAILQFDLQRSFKNLSTAHLPVDSNIPISCWPETSRPPDISPTKMGSFGISRKFHSGSAITASKSPQGKRRTVYRGKGKLVGLQSRV